MNRRRFVAASAAITAAASGPGRGKASPAPAADVAALLKQSWDYVIVGAGAAGCVLAARLSESGQARVLLLEAGGDVRDAAVDSPQAWPTLQGGAYDWGYRSTPQAGLGGRVIAQPRGKGLGGSTLINALGFQRGPREAYDRWARQTGDRGWGYDALLPYFRKLETASSGADAYRGGDGPLHVLEVAGAPDRNAFALAIARAGVEAGHPENPDFNGARADGLCWAQLCVRDGRRDSAATAYLYPVRARPNLGIATGVTALRLDIRKGRCHGVVVSLGAEVLTVRAGVETILSAGALDSPRLLMLSGVGAADQLKRVGVSPAVDLPGVGRHLQDHPLGPGMLFQASQPLPVSNYNHCEDTIVGKSSRSPGWADIQVMALSVPFVSPDLGAPPANSFAFVPCVLDPKSRGSVTLASADPAAPAIIDPAYLQDADDVEAMVDAVEMGREIAAAPAMRAWIDREIFPGPAMRDRAELGAFMRKVASPFFHPVSTCRMGPASDPQSVLDTDCRVRGVEGLRIVDASIFPSIPQAMTQAAVYAVAERAADIIKGKA